MNSNTDEIMRYVYTQVSRIANENTTVNELIDIEPKLDKAIRELKKEIQTNNEFGNIHLYLKLSILMKYLRDAIRNSEKERQSQN
jgi:hypothetical protein